MDKVKMELTYIIVFSVFLMAYTFEFARQLKSILIVGELLIAVILALIIGFKVGRIEW